MSDEINDTNEQPNSRQVIRAVTTQSTPLETLVKQSVEEVKPVVINNVTVSDDFTMDVGTSGDHEKIINDPEIIEVPKAIIPEPIPEVIKNMINAEPIPEDIAKVQIEVETEEELFPLVGFYEEPEIEDNPKTSLIETSWRKPNPSYKNGKLHLMSKSDGKQHVFKAGTADEAIAIAKAELGLFYDISNLVL